MLLIGTRLAWYSVVLILLYSIDSSFASPIQHALERTEVAFSKFNVTLRNAYERLIGFFRPVTCHHRDEQTLIPCYVEEDLNTTECLENNCCPSQASHELTCYMPFRDRTRQEDFSDRQSCQTRMINMQLAFRVLMLVAGGFLILGCLPFCCCAFLQRSQCVNPLRKASNKVKKIVLKKREHSEDVYSPLLD